MLHLLRAVLSVSSLKVPMVSICTDLRSSIKHSSSADFCELKHCYKLVTYYAHAPLDNIKMRRYCGPPREYNYLLPPSQRQCLAASSGKRRLDRYEPAELEKLTLLVIDRVDYDLILGSISQDRVSPNFCFCWIPGWDQRIEQVA
jgi:hypothetical protein